MQNSLINLPTKEVAKNFIYARGNFFRVVATCEPNPRGPDDARPSVVGPVRVSKRHGSARTSLITPPI